MQHTTNKGGPRVFIPAPRVTTRLTRRKPSSRRGRTRATGHLGHACAACTPRCPLIKAYALRYSTVYFFRWGDGPGRYTVDIVSLECRAVVTRRWPLQYLGWFILNKPLSHTRRWLIFRIQLLMPKSNKPGAPPLLRPGRPTRARAVALPCGCAAVRLCGLPAWLLVLPADGAASASATAVPRAPHDADLGASLHLDDHAGGVAQLVQQGALAQARLLFALGADWWVRLRLRLRIRFRARAIVRVRARVRVRVRVPVRSGLG